MNKKFISFMMVALVIVAFATPLVSASSETGSGQSRTVTLADSFVDTNTTVVVPTILNNETVNSFAFVVEDESGVSSSYTFNITIYDNNVTWYNGTVDVVGVPSENTTGYINFTADQVALVIDANITITMQWSNWTASNDDVWYGEIDFVDAQTYNLRVTTPSILISVMGIGIIIIIFAGIMNSTFKNVKDKKK